MADIDSEGAKAFQKTFEHSIGVFCGFKKGELAHLLHDNGASLKFLPQLEFRGILKDPIKPLQASDLPMGAGNLLAPDGFTQLFSQLMQLFEGIVEGFPSADQVFDPDTMTAYLAQDPMKRIF